MPIPAVATSNTTTGPPGPCCLARYIVVRAVAAPTLRDAIAIRHPQLRHSVHDRTRKSRLDLLIRYRATPHQVANYRFVSKHRGLDQAEVPDKPVSVSDVRIFGKTCIDMGVREAAVVMVSDRQEAPDVGVWLGSSLEC